MPAPLEADNLRNLSGIRHGFFTREGGVSAGIYSGLNCGLGSNDATDLVLENRRRVSRHLGGASDEVVTLYQEHGTTARTVSGSLAREGLPRADAVVSVTPGLVVGVLTADPEARVVAAAHAGWRGAIGGIIDSVVDEMVRQGARRPHIRAAIGPCIGQAAYEVGPEFQEEFLSRDPEYRQFFIPSDSDLNPHFDLTGFVYQCLNHTRIGSVQSLSPCTFENESLFFSYRRRTRRNEADYGRQISAIVVA